MNKSNTLVLYKNQPAIIIESSIDKITIEYCSKPSCNGKPPVFQQQKVREKDFSVIYKDTEITKNDLQNLIQLKITDQSIQILKEIHELLIADETTNSSCISFSEIVELSGLSKIEFIWQLFLTIQETYYFKGNQQSLTYIPRSMEEITILQAKQQDKNKELELRNEFIKRLKAKKLNLPDDMQFMQDVEALALGKTDKSKTMKEIGFSETPEKAHKLLLDTGVWPIEKNPYPSRWNLSMSSATESLASPPQEDRIVLEHIAYAIDNDWSSDPDDAIAFDGKYVWIHIADPASSVLPDSEIDIVARNRGSTLYIPEGAARMLSESCLEDYALGLTEKSRALSFKILLDEKGFIIDCDVLITLINVKRLTYIEADENKETAQLKPLFEIAEKLTKRRNNAGAISISLPEVHILTTDNDVNIIPITETKAASVIKEFMLLAGEAAAKFAFKNNIPFPFISQEKPEIPNKLPEGLAGQYKLRRCMRSRSVGVTPSQHAGLGLGMYSQVTSPLRRYSDLVAHQQLRAFLKNEKILDKDQVLERIAAGDAAASATVKAERKSNLHWTLVFLIKHKEWTGDAIIVDIKNHQAICIIPSLAMETTLNIPSNLKLNDIIKVKAGNINIPLLTVDFTQI